MSAKKNKAVEKKKGSKKEINLKQHDGFIRVERKYPYVEPKVTEEIIVVGLFATEVAKIGCSKGLTVSLGKGTYEFARVDVFCTLPCYIEEAGEAYKQASKFCEQRLKPEVEAIREYATQRKEKSIL